MKELEENTIEQIRTPLNYLEQTDLLKNKDRSRIKVFEPFEDISKPSPSIYVIMI